MSRLYYISKEPSQIEPDVILYQACSIITGWKGTEYILRSMAVIQGEDHEQALITIAGMM